MKKLILSLFCFLSFLFASSQTNISGIINDYTAVTSIIPCNNQMEVVDASEFSIGDSVLIIQMKGATMNTTNTASFGGVINLNNAGNYESNVVTNISGNTISFGNTLAHPYIVSGLVQIVRLPTYSGNVSVSATLTAQAWNGSTGGVLAFNVGGTLTLNADIDVSELGFRGGEYTNTANNCNFTSSHSDYFYGAGSEFGAPKGEGIVSSIVGMTNGRGKQVNGGGGGNDHNSAGGGGGSIGQGGRGGINNEPSFFGCSGNFAGIGGLDLNTANRIFMAGGGGSGHGNQVNPYFAGDGGGIVYIKADAIEGNSNNIIADGQNGNNGVPVDNDGGSGGGAGGLILLNTTNNSPTSSLNLSVKGGNGSNTFNNGNRCYGGGGGGGGGGIFTSLNALSLVIQIQGGTNGVLINSDASCTGMTLGAEPGDDGQFYNSSSYTLFHSNSSFTSSDTTINQTSCDSADLGTEMDTLTNSNGCDSIVTTVTSYLSGSDTTINQTSCDSADLGTEMDTLTNSNGCDSIVTTVTSYLSGSDTTINTTSCDITNAGTVSDTLTNVLGCDSIITRITTYIGIANTIINEAICEDSLPYTFPDGTIYTLNNDTSYQSTLLASNTCDSLVITNLTINNFGIMASIPDTIAVCESFNVQIEMNAENMQYYQWQVNEGAGFFNIQDTGIYSGSSTGILTISPLDINLTGKIYRINMIDDCGNGGFSDETYLRVTEPHEVQNPIEDMLRCLQDSSLIYVDYDGHDYVWSNGQTGQYLMVEEEANYELSYIENYTNCKMQDEFNVEIIDCIEDCVVMAPTGFSPKSSIGRNDLFRIVTTCDEGFSFFEFKVANRWGEIIYTTNNPEEAWDGTYKNTDVEMGVYVYWLEYVKNGQNKKESIKGEVSLIR